MQNKLLLWIRDRGLKQGEVAAAAGRSDAWISKRLRAHSETTEEDRRLIRAACSKLTGRRVSMADLFEPEAA